MESKKSRDELLRRNRLRFVARADQRLEMPIRSDDEVRVDADRAVGEFVIIPIRGHSEKMEKSGDAQQRAIGGIRQVHEADEFLPSGRTEHARHHLLVFEQDIRGDGPQKLALHPSVDDSRKWVRTVGCLDQHVGIDDDDLVQDPAIATLTSAITSLSRSNLPSARS